MTAALALEAALSYVHGITDPVQKTRVIQQFEAILYDAIKRVCNHRYSYFLFHSKHFEFLIKLTKLYRRY